jgi:Skp family chaperone for outer membrane proteins
MAAGGSGTGRRLAAALAVGLTVGGPAPAQEATPETGAGAPPGPASFLFINQERILTGSKAGQALLAEEERQRDALRTEARALDQSFEEEERELTEKRPTLAPEEFRALSDAFDARVVQARRDQDERANELAQEFDQRRRQFYAQVAPILVTLMGRFEAKAIFDETSVLFVDPSLNITDAVIAEIDARTAAGEDADTAPESPEEEDPAPQPAPAAPEAPAAGTDGGD